MILATNPDTSGFRNLQSFVMFSSILNLKDVSPDGTHSVTFNEGLSSFPKKTIKMDGPKSFFVSGVEWDVDKVVSIARHINFFMRLYDTRSPQIVIHEEIQSEEKLMVRYPRETSFPRIIVGKEIDETLLAFWHFAQRTDTVQQYLTFYRVIEYAAVLYVEGQSKAELRKALSDPAFLNDISRSADRVLNILLEGRKDDVPRFNVTIRDLVSGRELWTEVCNHKDALSVETTFDGGAKVAAFISQNETESTFIPKYVDSFGNKIRQIRNVLSHGKDVGTLGVIMPTSRNSFLLRPWVHLLSVAASEIMLKKDV